LIEGLQNPFWAAPLILWGQERRLYTGVEIFLDIIADPLDMLEVGTEKFQALPTF